jgi:hypothetical protein
MNNDINNGLDYDKKLIKLGMITVSFAIIANFIPAIYLWIVHGVFPGFVNIFKIWGMMAAVYGISWVAQPIAYFGVLGASGSYIGWLAGSVGDIRLPAAAMAQKVSKTEAGTHEGDVMATIGTASSVLVSVGFVTLFTFIGAQVLPMFPEFITKSFSYILPSLFAAVYIDIACKDLRSGSTALLAAFILMYICTVMKVSAAIITLIIVASGVIVNRVYYVIHRDREKKAS